MSIKKVYAEVHELLVANKNLTVEKLMPQLLELFESRQNDKNFKTDENNVVTEVFCYYHKKWENVTAVEYGTKSSSATGLNSMCKVGVNHWTKQQRVHKKAKADLLDRLASGDLDIIDLQAELEKIESAKHAIEPLVLEAVQ
jgi:hypothetical protein